jgi:hypothetical protein
MTVLFVVTYHSSLGLAWGHYNTWSWKFLPRSLILIPSATLIHTNIPVGKGEKCAVITQFCFGEVFHLIDNGFKIEAQLKEQDFEKHKHITMLKKSQWVHGLRLYKTLDELIDSNSLECSLNC